MKTTLALLCGGISSEAYLSRRSFQQIYKEFDFKKFDIFVLDWQLDGTVIESVINQPSNTKTLHKNIIQCFSSFHGDVVVNLLHSELENSGQIQGLLELAQIPYTGNNIASSVIGMSKILTKRCFRELGINCPDDFLFQPKNNDDIEIQLANLHDAALRYPLIIKPTKGGSSIGIQLVNNEKELLDFFSQNNDLTTYIVEEFIQGEEYCVGLFATHNSSSPIIFPAARINYQGVFFDASIKHNDKYNVDFSSNIKASLSEEMEKAASKAHNYIGFNGFCRYDFIVKDDEIFALEVNTHPGMGQNSILPNMVKHADILLGSLFEEMIEEALNGW